MSDEVLTHRIMVRPSGRAGCVMVEIRLEEGHEDLSSKLTIYGGLVPAPLATDENIAALIAYELKRSTSDYNAFKKDNP